MGWPVLKRDHVTKTPKVLFCVREVIKLIFASQQVILFSEIWMKDHLDQCLLILTYCLSCQLEFRATTKLLHPCLSLASLWMVPQLWFMLFISASTVLCQVVFG